MNFEFIVDVFALCLSCRFINSYNTLSNRDELITKSKYLEEEEAKRKAAEEAEQTGLISGTSSSNSGNSADSSDNIGGSVASGSGSSAIASDRTSGGAAGDELLQQDQEDPDDESSAQDDDVFYDSDGGEKEEENCKPCPVVKPTFMCGSDNRTYSSLCRLEYHNCIHGSLVKVNCKGFCPCKGEFSRGFRVQSDGSLLNCIGWQPCHKTSLKHSFV